MGSTVKPAADLSRQPQPSTMDYSSILLPQTFQSPTFVRHPDSLSICPPALIRHPGPTPQPTLPNPTRPPALLARSQPPPSAHHPGPRPQPRPPNHPSFVRHPGARAQTFQPAPRAHPPSCPTPPTNTSQSPHVRAPSWRACPNLSPALLARSQPAPIPLVRAPFWRACSNLSPALLARPQPSRTFHVTSTQSNQALTPPARNSSSTILCRKANPMTETPRITKRRTSSDKQIAASQTNRAKSKGPVTDTGTRNATANLVQNARLLSRQLAGPLVSPAEAHRPPSAAPNPSTHAFNINADGESVVRELCRRTSPPPLRRQHHLGILPPRQPPRRTPRRPPHRRPLAPAPLLAGRTQKHLRRNAHRPPHAPPPQPADQANLWPSWRSPSPKPSTKAPICPSTQPPDPEIRHLTASLRAA